MIRGDSGSIVVDAVTNTIYGHVVGSNLIGEVYISPYAAVFEQIQGGFPGSAVAIPEPISTLANLISVCTMSVRDESGLEFLGRLEEAYGKATAGLDGANPISPRYLQLHSSDATAGISDDQNPPCNTLYVANLLIDTSEEELKAMFSKQRGYMRLCLRTNQNGCMCFVEFEDVSHATKALYELHGHMLHNSVKGGIRLSFPKNPLGV